MDNLFIVFCVQEVNMYMIYGWCSVV